MTEKEAVERLSYLKNKAEVALNTTESNCSWVKEDVAGTIKAFDMAIKVLEKQIPLKPKFYAHNYHCANCANLVGNNEFGWQRFLYCDKCGWKVDWSDEDE